MPNSTPKKKFDGSAVSLTLTWDPLNVTWDPLNLTWQPLNPCFDMQPAPPSNEGTRAALRAVADYLRATLPDPPPPTLADLRAHGLDLDPATGQLRLYVETATPNPTDR